MAGNWIAILVRLALGSIFLIYGIAKVTNYAEVTQRIAHGFADTWLPMFVVWPFAWAIPAAELLVGILLLAGYRYRETLFATGLLLALLTAGKAIQGDGETVARNLPYILLVCVGLMSIDRTAISGAAKEPPVL